MTTDSDSRAIEAFHSHGGHLRTKDALKMGVHPRTLYRLRDQQWIVSVSRGIYRLAEAPAFSQPDLVTVALRVPRATICLVSALAYHDATSEIPHEVQIALPRRTKSPSLDFPPVRVFWFSGAALSEGVSIVKIDDVEVRIYDLAKTVVDCFRFRNKLGLDVAIEGLTHAIHHHRVRPSEVLRYARLCRIESVILPYVEALQ